VLSELRANILQALVARVNSWWAEVVHERLYASVEQVPPNPSIEGTCNIRLRRLSPAPHVKR